MTLKTTGSTWAAAAPGRTLSGKSHPAVSILASIDCCKAAKTLKGARILAEEAPSLPLPDCTANCRCRYIKYTDRRNVEDSRRFPYASERALWHADERRVKTRGRRKDD